MRPDASLFLPKLKGDLDLAGCRGRQDDPLDARRLRPLLVVRSATASGDLTKPDRRLRGREFDDRHSPSPSPSSFSCCCLIISSRLKAFCEIAWSSGPMNDGATRTRETTRARGGSS